MNYKIYVAQIRKQMESHKKNVDMLVSSYQALSDKKMKELEEMKKSGKYSDSYIKETEKNIKNTSNYPGFSDKLKMLQTQNREVIEPRLKLIENELNNYINAPVSPDFANKMMAFKTMGTKLSNREFELLKSTAHSYYEMRLLNDLAMSRTEHGKKYSMDGVEPKVENVESANPYTQLDIPNIDNLYSSFDSFKNGVNTFSKNYCGEDAQLRHFMDGFDNSNMAISQVAHAGTLAQKEFSFMNDFNNVTDKAFSISPAYTEMTEHEKKLIDAIIDPDPKYTNLAKSRAKELAAFPELANILSKDDRYSDSVASVFSGTDN